VEQPGTVVPERAWTTSARVLRVAGDVFDNQVDPSWRADLFNLIRACDELDWQLLTKRPQNIRKMLPADWGDGYRNVWLGATTEDARAYKQRAARLLKVPATIHFVSYEPAIGPLGELEIDGRSPDWVIIGRERRSVGPHSSDRPTMGAQCNRRMPPRRSRTVLETVGHVQEQPVPRRGRPYRTASNEDRPT
jgi:protein gp37